MNEMKIPKRILGGLLNSIGSGVVPRKGLEYIAIGRDEEIKALAEDLEFVEYGGSRYRFIIGRFGSGKSFLLQLLRNHCLERNFITADADLAGDIRLTGTKGQGVALYRQLMINLASKASPDGNALVGLISKWLMQIQTKIISEKGLDPSSGEYKNAVTAEIFTVVSSLENLVCGYDFANVINRYFRAYQDGDEVTKSNAIRWIRGEYNTKTEAKADLKVGSIVDDANWYDFLKLIAAFVRRLGYGGLIVFIDECIELYKITNRVSRELNYEKILTMFNDTLQSKAEGLCFIMGGTPQFLEDPRRGLYSYEALKSRLTDSKFAGNYKNFMSPVIRLERLTDDEIFALCLRLASLHSSYYEYSNIPSDSEIFAFLKAYLSRVGAGKMVTPREIIRDFTSALNILYQNPESNFIELVKLTDTEKSVKEAQSASKDEDTSYADSESNSEVNPSGDSVNIPPSSISLNDIEF